MQEKKIDLNRMQELLTNFSDDEKKLENTISVLLEFAMFPTSADGREGSSVSKQVSKVIDAIDKSGVSYQLTAMGTIIEASSMKEALSIVELAYEQLEDCERVYSSLKFDIRKNCENRLTSKVEKVEKTLNRKVNS